MTGKELPVLVYGAGGQGKVVADILEHAGRPILGFLDDMPEVWGQTVLGHHILGGFRFLKTGYRDEFLVVLAVGDNAARMVLASRVKALGYRFAIAIHPSALVSRSARIEPGTVVMAQAVVNPGARVGAHVIVNTGAIIEHDCVIHDYAHICPRVTLGGNVVVGKGTQVGIASCVLPGVRLGAHSVVGARSVVTRDIPAGVIAFGAPAKPIRANGRIEESHEYTPSTA